MEYLGFLKVEINCSSFNGENAISLNLTLNYSFGIQIKRYGSISCSDKPYENIL